MKSSKLSIRPYARLLTMLGEQLIKNERIALVELIKNAYDADADWVQVRFENFNDDMTTNEDSSIVIEDNGSGMTDEEIRKAWMNPATPQKYLKKVEGKRKTKKKKRVIQGEKGIGRFAILKLGKDISVTTRCEGDESESVILHNFSQYDDDFTQQNKKEKEIYLDDLRAELSKRLPLEIIKKSIPPVTKNREEHGTLIKISRLKGNWGETSIGEVCKDVLSLIDPISRISGKEGADDFRISIVCNGDAISIDDENVEILKGLIENNAVLRVIGKFDNTENTICFSVNEEDEESISLDDRNIKGLWVWRQNFEDEKDDDYECGGFDFHFYIFDFSRGLSSKYSLSSEQKKLLKKYRIYLYRDSVRVYPYGDSNDDWLNIDAFRGTGKVGDFFSNDQVVGWIDISQKNNPNLRDKTNREGLIEKGKSVHDFIGLIQAILSYLKHHQYARYQERKRDKELAAAIHNEIVSQYLLDLREALNKRKDSAGVRQVKKIEKAYKKEKEYLIQRAEITEDLAGVGLSVEMTSHDIMLMMGRARDLGKTIASLSRRSGNDRIQEQSEQLVGVLDQISDGMQDIQVLFKSSKRRRKALKIVPVLDNIYQLYGGLLEKKKIHYDKNVSHGSPLVADTTDGVIMQVLINLFDNASYWLDYAETKHKKILVTINGDDGELIFSDNGPGIDKEDEPYIFEPFYSSKGREGRGLGLYIARQLLERHDYRIFIAPNHQKKLAGANFVVSFSKENNNEH